MPRGDVKASRARDLSSHHGPWLSKPVTLRGMRPEWKVTIRGADKRVLAALASAHVKAAGLQENEVTGEQVWGDVEAIVPANSADEARERVTKLLPDGEHVVDERVERVESG
jgi:hypothetical protein